MLLFHRENQLWEEAKIFPAGENELETIRTDGRFEFDWEEETARGIYAISLVSPEKIVGVASLKDVPSELRLEISLLEVSMENVGKKREYEGIAGCLIAFACRLAFNRGYFGFVSLVPKTRLIEHYMKTYGFRQYGRQLAIDLEDADALIKKYLDRERD